MGSRLRRGGSLIAFAFALLLVTSPAWADVVGALAKASIDFLDPETGKEVRCDLPVSQHLRNLPDGGGCCVWASLDMLARWQHYKPLIGVLNDRLGPANQEDVDRMFARRAPGFKGYVWSRNAADCVAIMDWSCKTSRGCMIKIAYGELYRGPINHAVYLVHLDPEGTSNARAAYIDNNDPGKIWWMTRKELITRCTTRGAWCLALTVPPPPPIAVLK